MENKNWRTYINESLFNNLKFVLLLWICEVSESARDYEKSYWNERKKILKPQNIIKIFMTSMAEAKQLTPRPSTEHNLSTFPNDPLAESWSSTWLRDTAVLLFNSRVTFFCGGLPLRITVTSFGLMKSRALSLRKAMWWKFSTLPRMCGFTNSWMKRNRLYHFFSESP